MLYMTRDEVSAVSDYVSFDTADRVYHLRRDDDGLLHILEPTGETYRMTPRERGELPLLRLQHSRRRDARQLLDGHRPQNGATS